jgi:hypothetical protein
MWSWTACMPILVILSGWCGEGRFHVPFNAEHDFLTLGEMPTGPQYIAQNLHLHHFLSNHCSFQIKPY